MGEEGRIQERYCLKSLLALSCNILLCLESKEFRILSTFLHNNQLLTNYQFSVFPHIPILLYSFFPKFLTLLTFLFCYKTSLDTVKKKHLKMVSKDIWRVLSLLLIVMNFNYLIFFLQIPKIGHILYVLVSFIDWKENLYNRFRRRCLHFRGLKSHSDKSFTKVIANEAENKCFSNLFSPSTMFCIKTAV